MTLAEWLDRLRTELGDDPRLALSAELAGLALAEVASPDREERLRRLVEVLS